MRGSAVLTITSPHGEVVPYVDKAHEYLKAGADANVVKYGANEFKNPQKAVTIKWTCDGKVDKFAVEYATKADYSDVIRASCDGATDSLSIFNLYKGTKYYLRVIAYDANGDVLTFDESTFQTTSIGPRVMDIDGIHNVRDLGGYVAEDGKTTVQGLVYRGGALRPVDGSDSNLTEEGARYMREVLGIKTEIDFRSRKEAGNFTQSLIPGVRLEYVTLSGYSDAFDKYAPAYKETFSMLADKNNYPIYYHCTGGADRTGTVSFLFNALLGVSEEICIQDYEFTSYSVYGERNAKAGAFSTYFIPFRERIETFSGDTLQEKVTTYLLSIGLLQEELDSIKDIMFGKK